MELQLKEFTNQPSKDKAKAYEEAIEKGPWDRVGCKWIILQEKAFGYPWKLVNEGRD